MITKRQILQLIQDEMLKIEPFDKLYLSEASYDLTLGNGFGYVMPQIGQAYIDVVSPNYEVRTVTQDQYLLQPGEFVLGITNEYITMPTTHIAYLSGKSSLARLGLTIHATAGFIHPGFSGKIVLEIYNMSSNKIMLKCGMPIAQLFFFKLEEEVQAYHGKYRHQDSIIS